MGRLRAQFTRFFLRLSHKLLPKCRRYFRFVGLNLFIPSGVFNPTYTLSTKLIIDHASPEGKVTELGSGSGAIATYMAKNPRVKEVIVYDIIPKAIATSLINAKLNNVAEKVKAVYSEEELLSIEKQDYVIINPPYLPLEPEDRLDLGWCGGEDLKLLKKMIREGYILLKEGGILVLAVSSISGLNQVMNYLKSLGLKPHIVASTKSLIDTIYLVFALKAGITVNHRLKSREIRTLSTHIVDNLMKTFRKP